MGRKNRSKKIVDPGKVKEFVVNPFAGIDIDLPVAEEPPPKPKPSQPPKAAEAANKKPLDPEDAELLSAFSEAAATTDIVGGPVLMMGIEKKGRGGKTITWIRGLQNLDLGAQMALSKDIRKALGLGASFYDGILELQGNQRQRAGAWFEAKGYRVRQS